jgi:hypothetical protein
MLQGMAHEGLKKAIQFTQFSTYFEKESPA